MKKILSADGYDLPRLRGIQHETYLRKIGKDYKSGDVIVYGEGEIIITEPEESKDGVVIKEVKYGLVLDDEGEYFEFMPSVHKNEVRMKDYTPPLEPTKDK